VRDASCVRCSSISPKISSSFSLLAGREVSRNSPAPYTTHCLTREEGSHFLVLRMAASRRATGLPSSVATISSGVYPGVDS